jgi:integrase
VRAPLGEQLAYHTGDVICPFVFTRDGEPVKAFRKSWDNACAAAGYPTKIPHDFRRTAVRNFERAGVSRSVAMQITGHKTESVYRRYAIVARATCVRASGSSRTT